MNEWKQKMNPHIHEHWWPKSNAAFNLIFLTITFVDITLSFWFNHVIFLFFFLLITAQPFLLTHLYKQMSLVIYSAVLKEDLPCFKSTDNAKGSPFPQHFHTYVSLRFQKERDFNRLFAHEVASLCSCGVNCRCRASFAPSTVAQIDRTKKPQEALIKYQKLT